MSTHIDGNVHTVVPLTEEQRRALERIGLTGFVLVNRRDGRPLTTDDRKAALATLHGGASPGGGPGA